MPSSIKWAHRVRVLTVAAVVAVAMLGADFAGAWESLGGVYNGAPPAVGTNQDGRLEVYGLGLDNRIWRSVQRAANDPAHYDGPELMPGNATFAGSVSAVLNHWDRIEIFSRGRDGQLWHRWQNDPNVREMTRWSDWSAMGGRLAADPTACVRWDTRIEVFAVHDDGQIYHRHQLWFDAFGAPWSGWEPMPGPIFQGRVAAMLDPALRMLVAARGLDDAIYVNREVRTGVWSGWISLGGVVSGDPSLARVGVGEIVIVRGLDGRMWSRSTSTDGVWQPIGEAVFAAGARAAVMQTSGSSVLIAARSQTNELAWTSTLRAYPHDWQAWERAGGGLTSEVAIGRAPNWSAELFVLGSARDIQHFER